MKRSKELRFSTVLIGAALFTALAASNVVFFNRQAEKSRKIENLVGQMEG